MDLFGGADAGSDVAVQADGRIVGAGEARNGSARSIAAVRLLP